MLLVKSLSPFRIVRAFNSKTLNYVTTGVIPYKNTDV